LKNLTALTQLLRLESSRPWILKIKRRSMTKK